MSMKKVRKKSLEGVVTSNRMNKTIVVTVTRKIKHPRYQKVVEVNKRYYAHNEDESLNVGDKVTIMESRPLSKLKRWRVVNTGNKTTA